MKALAVYGSSNGKNSASYRLGSSFMKGIESQDWSTDEIVLEDHHINHCLGCKSCWSKTPGQCVQNDDMTGILERQKGIDALVLATPLYFFTVPGKVKDYLDRQMPSYLEHFYQVIGKLPMDAKTWLDSLKFVLISPCGLPERSNFDGLKLTMQKIFGQAYAEDLLVPYASGVSIDKDMAMFSEIYQLCAEAGAEFAKLGHITKETRDRFDEGTTTAKMTVRRG